jgi:hypothetical protein
LSLILAGVIIESVASNTEKAYSQSQSTTIASLPSSVHSTGLLNGSLTVNIKADPANETEEYRYKPHPALSLYRKCTDIEDSRKCDASWVAWQQSLIFPLPSGYTPPTYKVTKRYVTLETRLEGETYKAEDGIPRFRPIPATATAPEIITRTVEEYITSTYWPQRHSRFPIEESMRDKSPWCIPTDEYCSQQWQILEQSLLKDTDAPPRPTLLQPPGVWCAKPNVLAAEECELFVKEEVVLFYWPNTSMSPTPLPVTTSSIVFGAQDLYEIPIKWADNPEQVCVCKECKVPEANDTYQSNSTSSRDLPNLVTEDDLVLCEWGGCKERARWEPFDPSSIVEHFTLSSTYVFTYPSGK